MANKKSKMKPQRQDQVLGRPRKRKATATVFNAWLADSPMEITDVAERLEIGLSTAYALADGSCLPGAALRLRIDALTQGKVSFKDWPTEARA